MHVFSSIPAVIQGLCNCLILVLDAGIIGAYLSTTAFIAFIVLVVFIIIIDLVVLLIPPPRLFTPGEREALAKSKVHQ